MPDPLSQRIRISLNRQWKFFLGDLPGAHQPDFDDAQWQTIGIPHSFDLPYFRTPEFHVGCGWYRKHFDVCEDWPTKRLFLEFQGVFQVAEVFINGQPIGRHEGGYTGFSLDITPAIKPGDNLLAVRVDNNWNPRIAPRAGEHIFPGGIYRDIDLVITAPLHVTWHGTFLTTPKVSALEAQVNVKTEIINDSPADRPCRLVTHLVDSDGQTLAEAKSICLIEPGKLAQIDQTFDPIVNPKLWHPDHPYLYSVLTRVYDNEQLVDEVRSPLGIRWFEWTPDRGFFLNGRRLYLRGANVHQDHAGWGIAITQAACFRDVKLMKEAGFNFLRGAHYPHHPAFADACDHLGIVFWSENCFWGKGGFGPEGYWNASAFPVNPQDEKPFADSCRQSLRDMIRINRNHPSIMVWSMTNEAFFTFNLDRAKLLMADLVNLSRALDPTRPAAIGGAQRGDVDKLGDIAGYNGDGARLFIDPGIPNMVSEYGAISKPPDAYDPFFGDLQSEKFPWRCGEAIWCGFDYGSIAGKQGLKGILHHSRLPKRSWHWYRNKYLKIPPPDWPGPGSPARLQISADKTTITGTSAADDCQIIISVLDANDIRLSNSPPVTLTIESGPGEFPTGPSITFAPDTDIPIMDGQAAIAFRSYYAGQTLIRATSPGLTSAEIVITTSGEPQFIAGQPSSAPRPYHPPSPSAAAIAAMKNIVNVARDRPSRASSESPSHPARLANDGDASTFWQAAPNDPDPWLQVDLEGFYQISGSKLIFFSAENHRYKIMISTDLSAWKSAVDRTQTVRTDPIRNDLFDPGTISRYVRVIFTAIPPGSPARLCEIEVHGLLWVR